ncbi:hypothetical protein cypCar_00004143 [Cyprinus carpio]|nr:hypothetical protein cypCar_00004143 [Cyprinus carpio]
MNESEGLRFRRLNRPQIITDETHEPQYKATSTYSGKVFRVTLLTLVAFLFLPLLVVVFLLESPIQPDVFSLNEPPLMTGCYEPNLKLRQAERLFEDRLIGPESLANIGDVLYTGTADGKIVKIEGRSIHVLATLGKPPCGEVKSLVSTGKMIGGRRLGFVNDLDVTQDGKKLYFTDSSSRWQRRDFMHLIMEATADGRVHVSGLNKGGMDTFIDNLPGFPDNIRRSSSGGYWVAMSAVRPNPGFSMLDFLSQRPWLKKLIFKLFSQDTLLKFVPRYSLVVELQDGGTCVRSFHDPHGMVAAYISEAHEYNGHLYLGSFRSPYLCKLDLSKV